MPNWKKVIVSGSDALLNSINVATTGSFLDGGVTITSSNDAEIYVDGNITASGNIQAVDGVFSGNVFAQQYIVSSSVTFITQSFSSGSTIFGDSFDDTHQFTGSVDVSGSITASGNISLNNTITFEAESTSSTIGTLINPDIAIKPESFINNNFDFSTSAIIGEKAIASHSIEEGTIVVSGSLGNRAAANGLRTSIPIAKIDMLGSSCEWDLQVEIHSTSSNADSQHFDPCIIKYPTVGVFLPGKSDTTYFGSTGASNSENRKFGFGVTRGSELSATWTNKGDGGGSDPFTYAGALITANNSPDFINKLGISLYSQAIKHQGIGGFTPSLGGPTSAPLLTQGSSIYSWIKWWIPSSDGSKILGGLSIDTGNTALFEDSGTSDSSKIIITLKYKYIA